MRKFIMNDIERAERNPQAIQVELMDIDEQILDLTPTMQEKNKLFQQAKAEFEVDKLRLKLLKERRSALQSVLKSISVY